MLFIYLNIAMIAATKTLLIRCNPLGFDFLWKSSQLYSVYIKYFLDF